MGFAQSTLPATSPTVLSTNVPATSSTADTVPARPAVPSASPAKVVYADGKLEVTANNSSLNQILRDICRLTGMTISGGVMEQRVFGAYGPAAPGQVLSDLLEGTGSNMLLRETASAAPAELILSPREGGVSPPNPGAPGFDGPSTDADSQSQPDAAPLHRVQYPPSPPHGRLPAYGGGPIAPQVGDGTAIQAPAVSPTSPNGVLTPEQIYQQLQQLQQLQRTQSQTQH
ncbi:MAG: hypothetical protein M3O31_16110 [Acidobacteriota bacterium]|nr:hypothetical protein [Acidobacteriota bacterium]